MPLFLAGYPDNMEAFLKANPGLSHVLIKFYVSKIIVREEPTDVATNMINGQDMKIIKSLSISSCISGSFMITVINTAMHVPFARYPGCHQKSNLRLAKSGVRLPVVKPILSRFEDRKISRKRRICSAFSGS